jgi:hypothetical protein
MASVVIFHPVFDVVVDDEIQFLVREAIMLRQHTVDLVNNTKIGFVRYRKLMS